MPATSLLPLQHMSPPDRCGNDSTSYASNTERREMFADQIFLIYAISVNRKLATNDIFKMVMRAGH
jgi:hypothetical protein